MLVNSLSADASAWCRPLFEGNVLPMLVCEPASGAILEANDLALACLARTREALAGAHVADLFVSPADPGAATCAAGDTETVRRIAGVDFEDRYVTLKFFPFEREGAIFDLVVLQDVSRHVAAEARLRDTQDELHRAQALARIGTWMWDATTDRHYTTSPDGYRVLGLRAQEVPVTTEEVLRLIHPDDLAMVARSRERALRDPTHRHDVEFRLLRPDGAILWIHAVAEVRRDETGRPVQMFGLLQDVTDRREAEEAVRRLEIGRAHV